ncbi:hypothetical protein [Candidatus Clostridium helianthi]|uniref:Uncharacterized protein n=1 Tax=Candidatus Clostridium helianthi TaxID=3381660 RepID=A0ABW8S9V5_9CLOT
MNKKVRNEICEWAQLIALILSMLYSYKDRILWSIYMLLVMLVIEFICKDREEE